METIYLFTTTKETLYKRDLLNACCLADQWTIEFGYKKSYVPPDLLSDIKEKLENHPAVIVFCEPVYDKETDTYYRYHPVRRGTILTATKDLAEGLTLRIRLLDAFNYSADEHVKRVEDFQAFVNGNPNRPRTKISDPLRGVPNIFVRSASECLPNDFWSPWARYWYSLVNYLRALKGLNDSYFIRFKPPAAAKQRGDSPFPMATHDQGRRPRWKLAGGKSYELALECRVGPKAVTRAIRLVTKPDLIGVVGPFIRQSADGTEVEFLVAVKNLFQVDFSLFEAGVGSGDECVSSELGGVVEVRPNRSLLFLTLALLVGGPIVLSLDSALLDRWFGTPSEQSPYWHGTTALWVAKAVGAVMLGIGGYLGFRKLPIKT